MKGYYITTYSSLNDSIQDGVTKKITSQIDTLNNIGFSVQLLKLYNNTYIFEKIKRKFFSSYYFNQLSEEIYNCDFFYLRKFMVTKSLLGLLKIIKLKSNAKILIEIPTYPYDKETTGSFSNVLTLLLDKVYRKILYKYVDRIVTFSNDDEIFKIKTIKIVNGIDCSQISARSSFNNSNSFNIVAVAKFSTWHGYDRLIKGLHLYYQNNPEKTVNVYFAGDGDTLPYYKQLTKDLNLCNYIFFKGFLTGDQLDELFDIADIAACSFGFHRTGVFLGSFLKSREYLARGIPMLSSTKIDIFPHNFPYCHYVPEDETPLDIHEIIKYYNNLLINKNITEISKEIRQFAKDNCDMSKTMVPVINYLKSNL